MLEGRIRESISKASTKALRKDGYLIGNIYGKGLSNIHCVFKLNDFLRTIRNKDSLVFSVKLEDKNLDVVIQEYQRDPVTSEILHVDLMLAQKGVVAKYKIPVKYFGVPVGLKNKGILMHSKKRILVKSAPENLLNEYKLDVSGLDVGHSIFVRDLPQLPNVKVIDDPSITIIGVIKAK